MGFILQLSLWSFASVSTSLPNVWLHTPLIYFNHLMSDNFHYYRKLVGYSLIVLSDLEMWQLPKSNFLPILIKARTAIYTKKNILVAWQRAGLILCNPRHVLDRLTYAQAPPSACSPTPPSEPPTPCNSSELHRRVRQATLQLKSKHANLDLAGLET